MPKFCKNKSGQSLIEYTAVIILIMVGIIIIEPYVIRSWNAHIKGWEDSTQDSFNDPLNAPKNAEIVLPACQCKYLTICSDVNDPTSCCGGKSLNTCLKTESGQREVCNSDCTPTLPDTCKPDPSCCYETSLGCSDKVAGCGNLNPNIHVFAKFCGDPNSATGESQKGFDCVSDDICSHKCLPPGSFDDTVPYKQIPCPNAESFVGSNVQYRYINTCTMPSDGTCEIQCQFPFEADMKNASCICPPKTQQEGTTCICSEIFVSRGKCINTPTEVQVGPEVGCPANFARVCDSIISAGCIPCPPVDGTWTKQYTGGLSTCSKVCDDGGGPGVRTQPYTWVCNPPTCSGNPCPLPAPADGVDTQNCTPSGICASCQDTTVSTPRCNLLGVAVPGVANGVSVSVACSTAPPCKTGTITGTCANGTWLGLADTCFP